MIKRRTDKGDFLEGSSKGAGEYSEKPFVMPLGAMTKGNLKRIVNASENSRSKFFKDPRFKNQFKLFTTRAGSLWVFVQGGYKKIREIAGKSTDAATLRWSGRYMRGLSLLSSRAALAEIGWRDDENKKLASYHEVSGAGKARKLRKQLGLTEHELSELGDWAKPVLTEIITTQLEELIALANSKDS